MKPLPYAQNAAQMQRKRLYNIMTFQLRQAMNHWAFPDASYLRLPVQTLDVNLAQALA
jgi:hypothetical protein